ncbi:MAG: ATP-binding protein [Eubacteriales bacterium]|nr:ATP-binding protein [Eubacteriales bacterium]
MTKIVPNLKRHKQDIRQFTQYSLSQIVKIVTEFEKMDHEVQVRRLTIHDIKNATKHFIDLIDDVKNDEEVIKIAEANDKLFSSVEGYNLIQYLLAYHDKLLNYEDCKVEMAYINFHQAIKKLSKLLMYRGMKKDVRIKFKGACRRSFSANKDLYLMYFILLENALKFSLERTEIDVVFSFTEEQELKIEISNECHTIALEEIDYIFNPGFRSESAVNSTKGSGLGLTLAKKIATISSVQLECRYEAISDKTGRFIMECIHKR